MNAAAQPETAPDGPAQVWSARFQQHYHNRFGAQTQARTVFLEGTRIEHAPAPRILEVGFGLGLNFLTTLAYVQTRDVSLDYHAFEFDPPPAKVMARVAQHHPAGDSALWRALIDAWPAASDSDFQTDRVPLVVCHGKRCVSISFADATACALPRAWADAVYLDGFSKAVNPEVWGDAFVDRLAASLRPRGWIATYSAAGSVRRALAAAGLRVERCSGLPGKREWLRAQRC